jgi:endonuclease/exonuclease/phosphatase family metal-dependent hydrolase
LAGHMPAPTFFTRLPVGRIDHVFISGELEVTAVEVPRTDLIRRASDHLPVIVELKLARVRQEVAEAVGETVALD